MQALDAAQFLRLTESGADLAVMGGDLNAEPGDLVHRIICQYADLNDSCTVANAAVSQFSVIILITKIIHKLKCHLLVIKTKKFNELSIKYNF